MWRKLKKWLLALAPLGAAVALFALFELVMRWLGISVRDPREHAALYVTILFFCAGGAVLLASALHFLLNRLPKRHSRRARFSLILREPPARAVALLKERSLPHRVAPEGVIIDERFTVEEADELRLCLERLGANARVVPG